MGLLSSKDSCNNKCKVLDPYYIVHIRALYASIVHMLFLVHVLSVPLLQAFTYCILRGFTAQFFLLMRPWATHSIEQLLDDCHVQLALNACNNLPDPHVPAIRSSLESVDHEGILELKGDFLTESLSNLDMKQNRNG